MSNRSLGRLASLARSSAIAAIFAFFTAFPALSQVTVSEKATIPPVTAMYAEAPAKMAVFNCPAVLVETQRFILDGSIKNTGQVPIDNVTASYAAGPQLDQLEETLTSSKGKIDASDATNSVMFRFGTLNPGEQVTYHLEYLAISEGTVQVTKVILGNQETCSIDVQLLGSVFAMKFNDLNANGAHDAGDPGLAGWSLNLSGHTVIDTDVDIDATTGGGGVTFTDLPPGNYRLAETMQEGWTQSKPGGNVPIDFTLHSDEDYETEFGNFAPGTIAGVKWNDLDGDGVRDAGEPLLQGWTIKLNDQRTATTDVNGAYVFNDLAPGRYTVSEVLQAPWTQTFPPGGTHTVDVVSGGSYFADFGNRQPTSGISGVKYHDVNGNGRRDPGEEGLEGWTITLDDGTTTTTNGAGAYSFTGLQEGSYTVGEVLQQGWVQSAPEGGTYSVTLAAGQPIEGLDFGNYQPGTISGKKWNDVDGDGVRDATEPFLEGWTIQLDDGSSTTTDADGAYAFTGLDPGAYAVSEVLQDGWVQTYPHGGTHTAVVESGGTYEANFGNQARPGSLSGAKYEDLDGNGQRDHGEPGLEGWTITLNDGTSTTTYANGAYAFSDLQPGQYTVNEEMQQGWAQSAPAQGSYSVTLAPDAVESGLDFGNYRPGTITGVKWNDLDGDGTRDDNEPGLEGWRITLDDGTTTTTDPEGTYAFGGLKPGGYTVSEEPQHGWNQTFPQGGTHAFTVESGGQYQADFGNRQAGGGLSGGKYEDVNGNGHHDPNEPWLEGWTIKLDDGRTATTDASGTYVFHDLQPGTYTVSEVLVDGWIISAPATGSHTVTLQAGQFVEGLDFGNVRPGTLHGKKWRDDDGDGVRGAGEPTLPGWTIDLTGTDGKGGSVDVSTTTDADGQYAFAGLLPGTYTLAERQQSGWTQTAPPGGSYTLMLPSGASIEERDFGNEPPASMPGFISGQKFFDFNGNGSRERDADPDDGVDPDSLEVGLNGFTIELYDANGNLVDVQVTHSVDLNGDGEIDPWAEAGLFEFGPLPAGVYTVVEQGPPPPWHLTAPPSGSFNVDLRSGEHVVDLYFANTLPPPRQLDFGDLPQPKTTGPLDRSCSNVYPPARGKVTCYPTLQRAVIWPGASHVVGVDGAPWLGDVPPDAEPDGQPTIGAWGDDDAGVDDEDGFVKVTFFTGAVGAPGEGEITYFVHVPGPEGAWLSVWIDFNDDGILGDLPREHVCFEKITAPTVGPYTCRRFPLPDSTMRGGYLRARISTKEPAVASPWGIAPDGEVEDYLGLPGVDAGDAPDGTVQEASGFPRGYPTRFAADSNGAIHVFGGDYRIGDADTDADGRTAIDGFGFPSRYANGDDVERRDDEDGLRLEDGWRYLGTLPNAGTPVYGLLLGHTVTFRPLASRRGFFSGWVDWNRDGDWEDAGEHVFDGVPVDPGPSYTLLTMPIPADADPGWTYARFRFSQLDDEMPVDGQVVTGEVEDYLFGIAEMHAMDYGDAPPPYPTRDVDAGLRLAMMANGTLQLGATEDVEMDGQPKDMAMGDDDAPAGGDDEDGVTFVSELVQGQTASVQVVVAADGRRAGYVNGWIDFNRDGDWDDAGEHVIVDQLRADGAYAFPFDVPATAEPGMTYARFSVSETEGLAPRNDTDMDHAFLMPSIGEVEDYAVPIQETSTGTQPGDDVLPEGFALFQNYPNPFNPVTTISYDVARQTRVELRVLDLLGRELDVLVDRVQAPGHYDVSFDARDLPSGLYIYHIRMDRFSAVRKMVLLK